MTRSAPPPPREVDRPQCSSIPGQAGLTRFRCRVVRLVLAWSRTRTGLRYRFRRAEATKRRRRSRTRLRSRNVRSGRFSGATLAGAVKSGPPGMTRIESTFTTGSEEGASIGLPLDSPPITSRGDPVGSFGEGAGSAPPGSSGVGSGLGPAGVVGGRLGAWAGRVVGGRLGRNVWLLGRGEIPLGEYAVEVSRSLAGSKR